jgi:phage/conjugal plasmid C-4 type zinc finger TraR family protein
MADFADQASNQQALDIAQALANFTRHVQHLDAGRDQCVECGEIIPDPRRAAVPGCILCVSCQEQNENGGGFWA